MKINFLKKKNNFKKKSSDIYLSFYWEVVVLVTIAVISAFFIFGYYLFIQTNQEIVLPVANGSSQVGVVNKDSIEKVLNFFSERSETTTAILNSPAPVVDPSL